MNKPGHYTLGRLRRGFRHFLAGKLVGGLLGLATLTLVAHGLSVSDYASYVTILAGVELAIGLSTFGIDWVGIRYVPEYQVNAGGTRLRGFLLRLHGARFASLIGVATVLLLWELPASETLPVAVWRQVAGWYALLLIADGMTRFVNGVAFDSLLLQGRAQVTWIVRGMVFTGILSYLLVAGRTVDLVMLAKVEAVAAIVGFLVGTSLLLHAMYKNRLSEPIVPDWSAPTRGVFIRLAAHNYVSGALALVCSPALLLLIASRFLGPHAVAPLGFAFGLANQIRRYLPADMFIGLIRPMIIAEQAGRPDFQKLNRRAMFVFKLSLMALAPILIFLPAFGRGAMDLLSGGKYREAAWMLLGLVVVMIPLSHRRILEMVVNTIGLPHLWSRAALAMTLAVPMAGALMAVGFGPAALIGGLLVAELIANAMILRGCAETGRSYAWDRRGLVRIALGVLVAGMVLFPFGVVVAGFGRVIIAAGASVLLFLLIAMALRPFREDERALMNNVLPKRMFVW